MNGTGTRIVRMEQTAIVIDQRQIGPILKNVQSFQPDCLQSIPLCLYLVFVNDRIPTSDESLKIARRCEK